MSYQQALEEFHKLLARCQGIASAGEPEASRAEEEATQLAAWMIASVCGQVSDQSLSAIVTAKRSVEKR